jgi:acetyltransferase-like isoleucine patch superfamily enzyme
MTDSFIGENSQINANCRLRKVTCENNVALYDGGDYDQCSIGSYSYLAPNARISIAEIGRFCSIGPFLICGYGDHPTDFASTSPVFFSSGNQCGISFSYKNLFEERKRIHIGHDVWIGARVFVRDGVTIGTGAVLAAGTVIVKNVPDYAIVGGVPGKIIRYRFPEKIIVRMLQLKWWEWPEDKLREAQPYFAQNDINVFVDWADRSSIL